MKVLLVNKFFYPKGGSESIFFDTARVLVSKGHSVSFFSMADKRNLPSPYGKYFVANVDYENMNAAAGIRAAGKIIYSFEAERRMEELIKDERPDIAHLHNIHHQISPSIIRSLKRHGIPAVMTMHDYKMSCASYMMLAGGAVCEACRGRRYYHCLLKGCVKGSRMKSLVSTVEMYLHHSVLKIYDMIDLFIAPSSFLKDKLYEMGFRGETVHIPNFIFPDSLGPAPDRGGRTIAYCGRLSGEKGLKTLIAAMKGAGDLRLRIIGDGPDRSMLEKFAAETGAGIYFTGHLEEAALREEMAGAAFLVLPSEWYENSPRVIIESFAMARPVIGADIGGIPELVKDGHTGFTFKPGDPRDLGEKIRYLADHHDKALEMGRNARRFAAEELNGEKYYGSLMKAYGRAFERSGKKGS
ncbi:MAG: glycosyltransferase [Candidatus Omnitrophota bacterium]